MMTISVSTWWSLLCAVALFNMTAWLMSSLALHKRQSLLPPKAYSMRRLQLLLSAGYVLGCAFRSALPVFDVPRLVMLDTWLSSVVVGRSVATVAELCFVAQWALMLHEVSSSTASRLGRFAALAIVPMIAVAETFSWYSVLTTSNIGHVVEESLWGLSAGILALSLVLIWPRLSARQRPLLAAWCLIGIAYVAFMFMVDVPMYWSRWLADEANGRNYLSIYQGLADVSGRWTVSHAQQDWQGEMVWMTAYFSVAVWLSIALVHAPVAQPHAERA